MVDKRAEAMAKFAALIQDKDQLARLQKQAELIEFKEKYDIDRATPLKCPACSQWQMSGGSLWIHIEDKTLFTCRKCKLTFRVECQTISNDELILHIRSMLKGAKEE